VVDLDALTAAGIKNAHGRRALLEYLDSLGFSAEDMVAAEQRGRLFALSGDGALRSGPPTHSLRTAAQAIGRPLEHVEQAWAALGLTVADVDQVALSNEDVEGLRTWSELTTFVGEVASLGVLRVLGASMARFAEAVSSAVRGSVPAIQLNYTTDELTTARAYAGVTSFVPRIGRLLDAVHRQHLESARMYFEDVLRDASPTVHCGVGFVDLSGFTTLTQLMTPEELSLLLTEFSATVSEVVHADGGRVVKFIGDAVMWVSPSAEQLAKAAADLVDHPRARDTGLQVRAGLAYGPMLALDGDYYGNPVNLAARLVAAAAPGEILLSADLHDELNGLPAAATEPLTLRGFAEPVQAWALSHAAPNSATVDG
jgi:class 3 adenylate cyclase